MQMVLDELIGTQEPQEVDPREEADALFLSRLAQADATRVIPVQEEDQSDLRDLLNFVGRTGSEVVTGLPGLFVDIAQDIQRDPLAFTSVGDIQSGNIAAQEGRFAEAGLSTLLASTGIGGLLRKVFARRATQGIGQEGLQELAERRALRTRRSTSRGEGPSGRRASDAEAESILREAESAIFTDIAGETRRRATQGPDVNPIAELLRLLERGG